MMKRLLCLILCAIFLTAVVGAAEEIQSNADFPVHEFIELGDEGLPIADLLHYIGFNEIEYTGRDSEGEPVFSESAQSFLMSYQEVNGLETTGCFDPETAMHATLTINDPLTDLVWIPMHGGHKYHNEKECSNMVEPREVPKAVALCLEFTYCKHCWKNGDPDITNGNESR